MPRGGRTNPSPPRSPEAPGGNGGGGGGGAGDGGAGGGQGGGGGGGPPGGGGAPVGQNPNFALAPAMITDLPLDYTRPEHVKLYHKAVAPLEPEFDVTSAHLKSFVERFRTRAFSSNWSQTLTINIGGRNYDLSKDYGTITLEQVHAHVMTYHGTQTRNAQNAHQIFICLSTSLTEDGQNKVQLKAHLFTIGDQGDGLLLFRVIVSLAQVDTRATISVVRTNLALLHTKATEFDDNVTVLNEYVEKQMAILRSHREESTDLLNNLFKAYKSIKDPTFKIFINRLQDDWNRGQDISPATLMIEAENKYKELVEGLEWKEQTEEGKQIVALTAELEKMKKEKQATTKKDNKDKKGKGKKGKKGDSKGRKKDKDNKWRPPENKEETSRTINGKLYHYCPNHGKDGKTPRWVEHTLEDCRNKPDKAHSSEKKEEAQDKQPSLKVASLAVRYDDDDF